MRIIDEIPRVNRLRPLILATISKNAPSPARDAHCELESWLAVRAAQLAVDADADRLLPAVYRPCES